MSASTTTENPLGNIITFYSYKGGTGRSMALANVAWILASAGRRVLAVDWDLEAPGLHRYFAPFLSDRDLANSDGLIDLLINFRDATASSEGSTSSDPDWHLAYADTLAYAISLEWQFPRKGTLDLLPAGRQGASYSARVNSFDWEEFYEARGGGVFLEAVRENMRESYDYILIDSRTGVSDTSGICTVQMPDAVVVCFTLNNQGVEGAAAVAHSIYEQRTRCGKEISIFPVPMRVEPFEKNKLDVRREYAKKMFESFPAHLSPAERGHFQEECQVKYLPYYAYEEILATFGNKPRESESTSLLAPAEKLARYLSERLPGTPIYQFEADDYHETRRQSVLALFEGKEVQADPTQLLIQSAEAAWSGLRPDEDPVAREALLRLVRVAGPSEQSGDTRLLTRLSEFDKESQTILRRLSSTPLIGIERDPQTGEAAAQLSSDDLLRTWPRLQQWISEDRDFLLWRQGLNRSIAEWKSLREDPGTLLTGTPLENARKMQAERSEDLNEIETAYINSSIHQEEENQRKQADERLKVEKVADEYKQQAKAAEEFAVQTSIDFKRKLRLRLLGVGIVVLIAASVFGFYSYQSTRQTEQNQAAAEKLITDGLEEANRGNYDLALKKYDEALAKNPDSPNAHYYRGNIFLYQKQYDRAIADYDRAIQLSPGFAEAYASRGQLHMMQGKYDDALKDYDQALANADDKAAIYISRGDVYYQYRSGEAHSKLTEALADYEKAIQLNPKLASAYIGRGNVLSAQDNYDQAIADYSKALELEPKSNISYSNRCDAYLHRNSPGDLERALVDCNQAIKLDNLQPEAFVTRGDVYRLLSNRELALANYEKARALSTAAYNKNDIVSEIDKGLRQLGANPAEIQTTSISANPRIGIHYQDEKDLPAIQAIARALSTGNQFQVAGKAELVTQPTTGDVRYFYDEDKAAAERVKKIVETALDEKKIEKTLDLRLLKNLAPRVPQGWIEVWLPPLPSPSIPNRLFPGLGVRPPSGKPNMPQRREPQSEKNNPMQKKMPKY